MPSRSLCPEAAIETTITELGTRIFVAEIMGVFAVNVGIVVGDDGACVIDTGTTELEARKISEVVASVTDKPLTYVINTHHHGDHSFGNYWLRPAIVVGHNRCRIRLLGAAGESHREAFARLVPQAAEQIAAVVVEPPTVTFEEKMTLHLGNVSLHLQYFGRAHTDNDIAITVEGTTHCFAGDIIEESGPPVAIECFPREWGSTIRSLLRTGASSFVPGHGRGVDAAFVAAQAAAFEDVDASCQTAQSNGGAEADVPSMLTADTHRVLQTEVQTVIARHFASA